MIIGSTLYVGGTGPDNYTNIQDAIDDATAGDTVFVYDDSSPYYERLQLNKSIFLIGEEKRTTIIDGEGMNQDIATCTSAATMITGFTIFNCSMNRSCVLLNHTSHCFLQGNIIHTGKYGVTLKNSQNISIHNNSFAPLSATNIGYIGINILNCINSTIAQNTISSWTWGIFLYGSNLFIKQNIITNTHRGITDSMNAIHTWTNKYLTIQDNILNNISQGIHLLGSTDYTLTGNMIDNATSIGIYIAEDIIEGPTPKNITIKENIITSSRYGIEVDYAINASIESNQVQRSTLALMLKFNTFISVKENTFEGNNDTILYRWALFPVSRIHTKIPHFDNNFWDQALASPKPIYGRWGFFSSSIFFEPLYLFPWVTFDWHPAQEPKEMRESRGPYSRG